MSHVNTMKNQNKKAKSITATTNNNWVAVGVEKTTIQP